MNGFATAMIILKISGESVGQMFVATTPGCRQFTVTPVPWSRRASSNVNAFIISFESPYAFSDGGGPKPRRGGPSLRGADCTLVRSKRAPRCASDDTLTTREGALDFSRS